MADEILVPLKRHDRLEEIIPYIEKIARPGMRILFLVNYPVDGFDWLSRYVTTMETGIRRPAVRQMVERYTWEEQSRIAKRKVLPACKTLREKGAEIDVEVYAGSLRKIMRLRTLRGNVHLIVMRAGIGLRLSKFLGGTIPLFGLFSRPGFPPMLVLHPGTLL